MDLNPFIDWVRDGKGRKVSIELGEYGDNEKISIWAYDYIYATGQYVQSVDEIDIAKKKRR